MKSKLASCMHPCGVYISLFEIPYVKVILKIEKLEIARRDKQVFTLFT